MTQVFFPSTVVCKVQRESWRPQPRPAGKGVVESAAGGASPYPMLPYMGTMHGAIGAELADFLQGKESADQALADIEAAYIAAAKEKGFL